MPGPSLLQRAVANNAAWCDTVYRAHGSSGVFFEDAWLNPEPSPRYYPNVVTLSSEVTTARVAELLAGTSAEHPAVKDSFGQLDLAAVGCRRLFVAEWVAMAVPPPATVRGVTCSTVSDPHGLAEWTTRWAAEPGDELIFPSPLLEESAVAFWQIRRGPELLGGAVTFVGCDAVGISNVFLPHPPGDALRALLAAIRSTYGAMPIVGYESGDALRTALEAGFERLGPLAVWVRA